MLNKMLSKGKRRFVLEIPENIEFKDRTELYDYIFFCLNYQYDNKEDTFEVGKK